MPSYDNFDEDVFAPSSSRFLAPSSSTGPRKSPSKQSINGRRSSASLRGSSLAQSLEDDDAANGRHSLAHELAVALMPEPSAGSKLLAEEFGIEYDEGAEGIDEVPEHAQGEDITFGEAPQGETLEEAFAEHERQEIPSFAINPPPQEMDPAFGSAHSTPSKQTRLPNQDPMTTFAQDLEYTEKFLMTLRRLDGDHSGNSSSNLEQLASDMIRQINETTRDREGQVRELLECEREFRKISGEIGGNDVLGQLDELEDIDEDPAPSASQSTNTHTQNRTLDAIQEESTSSSHLAGHNSSDWEADLDRDRERLEDDDEYDSSVYSPSPVKATFSFPAPPPITGPPTPASAIPQLTHLRTFTASIATSLSTISEQTQVNTAATTDAGRKIRMLKNKLTGWRSEWDSAERSRLRIERWESGILEVDGADTPAVNGTPPRNGVRRVDGRKLVAEHMQAFEKALLEANTRTQAIMLAVKA